MTEKGRSDKLEVARITGVLAAEGADVPLPTSEEDAPRPVKTCAVCAADNDGAREACWNCGASLRRVR